jgi:hypothetical protein
MHPSESGSTEVTKIKKILQRYVIYISDQITVPYLNIETGNRRLNIVDGMFSLDKQISKLNIKKQQGMTLLSPKILKLAQSSISNPIKILVNKSIESSIFPENLKSMQVAFERSIKIAAISVLSSRAFFQSSIIF